MPPRYEIEIAPTGYRSLKGLRDKRLRRQIAKAIDGLARAPEKQGKLLLGPLEGIRSLHVARDQFRILYRVDVRAKLVSILLIGKRSPGRDADVYALAQKLLTTFLRKTEKN